MKRKRLIWSIVLVVSIVLLISYGFFMVNIMRTGIRDNGYYGMGMMNPWFNRYDQNVEGKEKLLPEKIAENVQEYLKNYYNNSALKISDMFVYKDSDYYVSIVESDTGKGAVELLVNPYTGGVYPEYGPNMMWNEKYSMHAGGWNGTMGMMRNRQAYPRGYYRNNDNSITNNTNRVSRTQALKAADEYAKKAAGKEYSVPGEGHEFYGYYTFHVSRGDAPAGMISVNYYTEDIWYHTWHGELKEIISFEEQEGE